MLKHGVLLIAGFIALVPTIFMVMTALKSDDEYTFNKVGFPHALVFDHFDVVLFESPFFNWMGNSAILAGGLGAAQHGGLLSRRLRHRADGVQGTAGCCSRSRWR